MRKVDTGEYVSMLRELTREGKEVSLQVNGGSMEPFLGHLRDTVCFKTPDRELRRGDIVFYQRATGQFVMHRIWAVKPDGYYIVGDAQRHVEGPVKREQIFGLIFKAKRKGKWIGPGDFWWEFFARVWIRLVPVRRPIARIYLAIRGIFRGKQA